ncbi:GNAT family N-acetyltransferase [Paenimyroides baculatum]|uniref:GNAT family N-acetyltransferase n=1 Tax=Paenimyroides baculatum TaxID=2608000 RepID=A0A5M6C8Y6_9FLAO|nr:GNAT family N-acetyltransferase [Paenimyroides baculatum]KAA5531626.1 GNAT family N-acetyltransferase [Paenimyroides baculatum]
MKKIREMKGEDVQLLADIWLRVSLKAHKFIPEEYWIENKYLMAEKYLPVSEVYVVEETDTILGFIALIGNHIASIFVDNEEQEKGIGSLLLNYAKELRTDLTLSVYQKNEKSVNFYKSKKFIILYETIDEPTGEKEFTMQWKKQ